LVKIRLKRMGTTKRPVYRLVVADAHSPRDGRFIESLGYYDPLPQPATVSIDADRVREWLRRGARPSDSARDLLVAQGILGGDARRRSAPAAGAPVAAAPAPAGPGPEPETAVAAGAEGDSETAEALAESAAENAEEAG
jgi:small subunit ribosomal protein S16